MEFTWKLYTELRAEKALVDVPLLEVRGRLLNEFKVTKTPHAKLRAVKTPPVADLESGKASLVLL